MPEQKIRAHTALWWGSNQRDKYSAVSLKHGPPETDIRLVRIRAYKAT